MSRYRVVFRGPDGLPHGEDVNALTDEEAIMFARRVYADRVDWVLKRQDRPTPIILAEGTTVGACSCGNEDVMGDLGCACDVSCGRAS